MYPETEGAKMSRCTEHTRRVLNPDTICCRCEMVLKPGEKYRQRTFVHEDFTEDSFEQSVAHSACVADDESWFLFRDSTSWKPPKLAHGLTKPQQHTLLHCLGMGSHIKISNHGFRNSGCYAAGSKSVLVDLGFMTSGRKINGGRDQYYVVTKKGGAAVGRPDLGVENAA